MELDGPMQAPIGSVQMERRHEIMVPGKDVLNFKGQGVLFPGHRFCYFLQKMEPYHPHQCTIAPGCLNSFSELCDVEGAADHLVFMRDRPELNG